VKIIDCVQGSPEWFEARVGLPTSSNFDKIITTQGKPSKSKEKYLYKLAGERIIEKSEDTYKNDVMLRGQELESEARQLYELMTGKTVEQVGLCVTEGKAIYGASPDGLVGEDTLLEIKCPIISTQVDYLVRGKLPTAYFQQIQGQLLVTERQYVDFFSYYPAMKPLLIRVVRDEVFLKALKFELEKFTVELDELVERIR